MEGLPKDLHDLYFAMLSRVEHGYRSQTAKILQLVECARSISAIGLWFAENADENLVLHTPVSPMSDEEVEDHVEQMEHRVKSRCRGLLEVRPRKIRRSSLKDLEERTGEGAYDISKTHMNAEVTFIHRSVVEFLRKRDIRDAFMSHPDISNFSPAAALFYSAVLLIKTFRLDHGRYWPALLKLAVLAGERAEMTLPAFQLEHGRVLDELDSVMTQHLAIYKTSPNRQTGKYDPFMAEPRPNSHWTTWYDLYKRPWHVARFQTRASFAAFAASHRLIAYLKYNVSKHGPDFLRNRGISLLGHALTGSYIWQDLNAGDMKMAEYLLEVGCRPTDKFVIRDVWYGYLASSQTDMQLAFALMKKTRHWINDYLHMLALLIPLGVDVNICIPHRYISDNGLEVHKKPETNSTLLRDILSLRSRFSGLDSELTTKLDRVANLLKE